MRGEISPVKPPSWPVITSSIRDAIPVPMPPYGGRGIVPPPPTVIPSRLVER